MASVSYSTFIHHSYPFSSLLHIFSTSISFISTRMHSSLVNYCC